MKTTARLAALMAIALLVTGCSTGLRHKDRIVREPVQLPSAPSLGGTSPPPQAAPEYDRCDAFPAVRDGTHTARGSPLIEPDLKVPGSSPLGRGCGHGLRRCRGMRPGPPVEGVPAPTLQELEPGLQPLSGAWGQLDHDGPGASFLEVPPREFAIESDGLGQVDLRDQGHVGRVDQGGVLERLVLALGHREEQARGGARPGRTRRGTRGSRHSR